MGRLGLDRVAGAAGLMVLAVAVSLRAEDIPWRLVDGQSPADFNKTWEDLRRKWFRIETFRAYDLKGEPRLAAVWVRNTDDRSWGSRHGLPAARLPDELLRLRTEGNRCVELAAFDDGGETSYLLAWVQNKEQLDWVAREQLSHDALVSEIAVQRKRGMRPVVFQGFNTGRNVGYNLVWVENKPDIRWSLEHDLTAGQLDSRIKVQREAGLRPVRLTSYSAGGVALYGLVFLETREKLDWQVFHDLSEREFRDQLGSLKGRFRLTDFDAYDTKQGPRYSGVWLENK